MMLRIKRVLEDKGFSLEWTADSLGISKKTLYNKISGRTEFNYREVRKLRAMLPEYNVDFLLTETQNSA